MSHDSAIIAHPNIALIKYWGKRPGPGNLPAVGSLSVTLDTLRTRTRVQLDTNLSHDELYYDNVLADAPSTARVQRFLATVRAMAKADPTVCCRVESSNNFPTAAGLASSASGFAALAKAACIAYGLTLTPGQMSALARCGSGSAARSIFGGFVHMAKGTLDDGSDSTARPIMSAAAWPLKVVVAITRKEAKAVGSTEGMERTRLTSPYWDAWVQHQERDLQEASAAVMAKDFAALADVAEHSCFKMHALALSARPKLLYWLPSTLAAILRVAQLRADDVPVFCTMDAGPQVKAICLPHAANDVATALRAVPGVLEVLVTGLGEGAHVSTQES